MYTVFSKLAVNNNRFLMKTNGLTNIIDNREFTILFVTKYKMLD